MRTHIEIRTGVLPENLLTEYTKSYIYANAGEITFMKTLVSALDAVSCVHYVYNHIDAKLETEV